MPKCLDSSNSGELVSTFRHHLDIARELGPLVFELKMSYGQNTSVLNTG